MSCPVTGFRGRGATTKMRCVDVAALFAAAILRRNPDSVVIPFDTRAYDVRVDPGDTILSLSERLAKYGGGGTDCSIPLHQANTKYRKRQFAGVVLVSDNESWDYGNRPYAYGRAGSTGVMTEWQQFVANQQRMGVSSPKLVCIDIQPYGSTQAPERAARQGRSHLGERGWLGNGNTQPSPSSSETAHGGLNIGGFSDAVFHVVADRKSVV